MAQKTEKQIEHAIRQTAGNLSQAAKALGISRSTINRRVSQSATLKQILEDAREELVDIAVSALKREVEDGNITAIIFTLKTQGKSRGYIERQEITGANSEPITIVIKEAKPLLDDKE